MRVTAAPECKNLRPMNRASTFLTGTKVLDMSIWRPGPYATSLLVALGADVAEGRAAGR